MNVRRSLFISIGALVLSTIAIQASDILNDIDGGLAGLLIESEVSVCGDGAIHLTFGSGQLCVDMYEAAAGEACPTQGSQSAQDTITNLDEPTCRSVSAVDEIPWTNVSFTEAQQLCARSGKRLPTASEWFDISLALADQNDCVIDTSSPRTTGSGCVSTAGVYDLVGNVWEWVDETITDGTFNNRTLPERGYVAAVDADGIVTETAEVAAAQYGADFAITSDTGTYGMIRGGFFDSGTDAGLFAQNLAVPFNLKTPGIGFRCVRSL